MDEPDTIISFTGFMGSGKSSVGRELARRLGWNFVDLDTEVEAAAGCSIPELFRNEGEAGFRRLETDTLEALLDTMARPAVLSLGGGTIIGDKPRRLVLERTKCIYLSASEDEILRRIGADTSLRPLFNLSRIQERLPIYRQAHYTVCTDNLTVRQVVDSILERKIV